MSRFTLPEIRLPGITPPRLRATATSGACTAVVLAAAACSGASAASVSSSSSSSPSVSTSPAPRGSATVGSIEITGAYLPRPATADVAAAYFTVADTGDQPDVLVSVSSTSAAQTSLMRESENAGNGAESMTALPGGLPIPAHGRVTLSPGGYHVMLTDPATPLEQGGTVTLILRFEHAGAVALKVPVTSLLSDAATGSAAPATASMPPMPGM